MQDFRVMLKEEKDLLEGGGGDRGGGDGGGGDRGDGGGGGDRRDLA